MSKPVIFTVSALWDEEAKVWSGRCDEIPAAADASTLDELMIKISRMALDLAAEPFVVKLAEPDAIPAATITTRPFSSLRAKRSNPAAP